MRIGAKPVNFTLNICSQIRKGILKTSKLKLREKKSTKLNSKLTSSKLTSPEHSSGLNAELSPSFGHHSGDLTKIHRIDITGTIVFDEVHLKASH